MKTITPYLSLEYHLLDHTPAIMHFVKNNKGEMMVLSPKKIKPLRKSKHCRTPKQILLFSEAMEKLCN